MHTADANTVALWPLDDSTPQSLKDLSPNELTLTSNATLMIPNSPSQTNSLPLCVSPAGSTRAYRVFDATTMGYISGALTVEFWYSSQESRNYYDTSMIIGVPRSTNDSVNSPVLIYFSGDSMKPIALWEYTHIYSYTTSYSVQSTVALNEYDRAWHYLVFVRSAPYLSGSTTYQDAAWYTDGVLTGQATTSSVYDNRLRGAQAGAFYLGGGIVGSYNGVLAYCLSDIRISNKARSAQEIADYYASCELPQSHGRHSIPPKITRNVIRPRINYARSSQPVIGLFKTTEDVIPIDTFTADQVNAAAGSITITFSDPCVISGHATDPSEWIVADPNGKLLQIKTVTANSNTIILTTDEQTNGAHYSVVFPSTGIQDNKGKRLDGPFSMGFTGVGVAPTIVWSKAIDARHIEICFSEPVLESDAINTANYAINNNLQVLAAEKTTSVTYRLTTSLQSSGVQYTITASNIRDLANNPV